MHTGLRRGDADFRLVANRALAQLYRTGQIAQVYDKWFGVKGELPYPMDARVRSFMLLQVVPK